METPFQKILELIVQTPGNLIYHLVLAFSVLSSLQAAIISRQNTSYAHVRRMIFGLGMLLLGQVLLFLSSGLAWQGILNQNAFLPPLDRAVLIFGLVWIVWLWCFPNPSKLGDLLVGFLSLVVVLLFLFSYTSWNAISIGQPFNLTDIDWAWSIGGIATAAVGLGILLFKRPPGWGYGTGMLILSLGGFVAHLLLPPVTDHLSAYIRLGQLAAYPLLPSLLYRFGMQGKAAKPPAKTSLDAAAEQFGEQRTRERRRYSAGPRTIHAWLELVNADSPEQRITGTAKALGHTMLSDLCFVVNGPNFGHVSLQSGYDLIREEEMKGVVLEQNTVPALLNALQRGKSLRITSTDAQPTDMGSLAAALGLEETGSLMYIPLASDAKPGSGLLFLSPYSSRQWSVDDLNYLASELELIAVILQNAQMHHERITGAELLSERLRADLENARVENQTYVQEIESLRQQIAAQISEQQTPAPVAVDELSALIALQQEAQDQITALQGENERLHSVLRSQSGDLFSPEDFSRMEAELRSTLQELAIQQNQIAKSNARVLMLERQVMLAESGGTSRPGSEEDQEVITSAVQELRQPMSSIIGYTDLLLAESVGILGTLQRKFLERIKASTERLHTLLNDLILLTSAEASASGMRPKMVDLGAVIDEAVINSSAQLREKNIALRVDLPQEIPQIPADRDALEQIILHLLQNAGSVTPQEGDIILRAGVKNEDGGEYLLVQVTDSGGGIPSENLPRVFSRRHRADMPLIQGLGDTGVGLSIVQTLVEAHGGRVWVDSVEGKGTTFCVLLPISDSQKPAEQP